MLLAYSIHLDVNLWVIPTRDSPSIERLKNLTLLCKSITDFRPESLLNNFELRAKFDAAVNSSQCLHLYRDMGLMNIQHECIFWDMDELPVALRDGSRNLNIKPIPQALQDREFSRYSKAWKMARRIFACSHVETNEMIGKSHYMPNVYTTKKICRKPNHSGNLLFVGNLNFFPNIDAIFYMAKNVLPLLPASINMTVVGRSPIMNEIKEKIDSLAKDGKIKFAFDVECCTPYYQEAMVAVAPLAYGAGTKLKVLEAFSHFCPLVSTSKGCEGLRVRDGRDVLIRDDPTEFAAACQLLMENPTIGDTLAKNAHNLLEKNYSQDILNDMLYRILSEEGIL